MWHAEKGSGCYFNGERCHASKSQKIEKNSFLLTDSVDPKDGTIRSRLPECYARGTGSAGINFGLVASGNADGFFATRQKAHELGAGNLLVREAGGMTIDFKGNLIDDLPYDFNAVHSAISAGTREIAEEILKAVQ